jgi:hypothetical protein
MRFNQDGIDGLVTLPLHPRDLCRSEPDRPCPPCRLRYTAARCAYSSTNPDDPVTLHLQCGSCGGGHDSAACPPPA